MADPAQMVRIVFVVSLMENLAPVETVVMMARFEVDYIRKDLRFELEESSYIAVHVEVIAMAVIQTDFLLEIELEAAAWP